MTRWSNNSARKSLASRLSLPYFEHMQDWEWEVADSQRFAEFLTTYDLDVLSEDERFSLMEIMVQCVEDMDTDLMRDTAWNAIGPLLRASLHDSTVRYWACIDVVDPISHFRVTPFMRNLLLNIAT